mgnify:FL=1
MQPYNQAFIFWGWDVTSWGWNFLITGLITVLVFWGLWNPPAPVGETMDNLRCFKLFNQPDKVWLWTLSPTQLGGSIAPWRLSVRSCFCLMISETWVSCRNFRLLLIRVSSSSRLHLKSWRYFSADVLLTSYQESILVVSSHASLLIFSIWNEIKKNYKEMSQSWIGYIRHIFLHRDEASAARTLTNSLK